MEHGRMVNSRIKETNANNIDDRIDDNVDLDLGIEKEKEKVVVEEEEIKLDETMIQPLSSSSSSSSTTANSLSTGTCNNNDEGELEEEANSERIIIQDYTRFSKSKIWNLMMKFYDKNGICSWADGIVPHFVSSNAYIGKAYAKILYGFIMDLCSTSSSSNNDDNRNRNMNINRNEKIYIVELGGGTGKLAFYILKAFEKMQNTIPFPLDKIVYVLTDFTESNIEFWEQNENLKPYVKSGRLEFAKFEAVNDVELRLRSGKVLKKGDIHNPICIIANYLIDTLCNDVFQVEKGVLKEGLVSVGVKEKLKANENNDDGDNDDDNDDDNVDDNTDTNNSDIDYSNDHDIIKNLQNEYKYIPVDTNYYTESVHQDDAIHYSRIMSWYKNYFKTKNDGASLLIPIGFLSAIRHLSDLSYGKAFIISGDKGNSNPDYFCGLADPHMAFHGSFSLMVNFHAISLYTMSQGGFALNSDQEESALQVNCFVLNGDDDGNANAITIENQNADMDTISLIHDEVKQLNKKRMSKYPALCHAFDESVNSFSPNDFFVIQKCLKEEANPSLLSIISLLKLSDWDPDIFYKFRDNILNAVSSTGARLQNDLTLGIDKIWDHYYHLGNYDNGKDVVFELGRLCYGLSLFEQALVYYKRSLSFYGDHHITFHNSGLCHFSLSNFEEAKSNFEKAIDLTPQYEKSQTWLERVEKELELRSEL